ncbi:helix-turn-helix domain-containing protein [Sandaracinobacteroides saxicola]|uniref:Helix-turn-helix domain-containing protein n=1 Tax=Sandaracinobacteroides saxicola TaxID=2759707 RepID=A0A7G5IKG3_9SPHN|nr:helix-turn-helix transcriptional regulator [Sandaracinobacteroides saxicola]QMW23855.1 helix-turn-helix domain-containing protein [Sandaracinobacteroides saxicola]
MTLGKLTAVAVTGPQSLMLGWDDGLTAAVSLGPVIAAHPGLAPLADPASFAAVTLSEDGWSLEWPAGPDFGAAQLRRWADEQRGAITSASVFRQWMTESSLTLDRAAEALGLSRRTVAYYLSGEQPIPRTVMLATEALTHRAAT